MSSTAALLPNPLLSEDKSGKKSSRELQGWITNYSGHTGNHVMAFALIKLSSGKNEHNKLSKVTFL
jgi:hypothetical protein